MRSRLRSHSGCIPCRQRRKKCGEEKPSCASCQRLGRACTWSSMKTTKENLSSKHFLHSFHTSLVVQSRFGTVRKLQPTPIELSSIQAISSDYDPFADEVEHGLFASIGGFLTEIQIHNDYCVRLSIPPPPHHELTVALRHPWVREPLLALAAMMFVSFQPLLPGGSYKRHANAIRAVHSKVQNATTIDDKEALLVALFSLAMIEVRQRHSCEQNAYHSRRITAVRTFFLAPISS